MKGSKQSKADHQAKQIQALINVVQQLLDETAFLKDLSRQSRRTKRRN